MKNTLLILLLITTSIYSQINNDNSFYSLKQQALTGIRENTHTEKLFVLDGTKEKKSTGLAILYSILLPGMGELYADSYNSGIYFTIADGVLWGTFIGMNVYGNWQKDRYISYAQTNAGITTDYKDDAYYATIGDYSDIDKYNDAKAFEGNFGDMYNTQQYYWKWNSTEERRSYRNMWVSSEQTFNDVRFVVGALILNRVVSAINAVRLVSKYNNNIKEEVGWDVSFSVKPNQNLPTTLSINFIKNF
jgi:hypothetical protein